MAESDSSGLSGTRVRVCYSDGYWYLGAIDSYHEPTGKYRISLDDGDRSVCYISFSPVFFASPVSKSTPLLCSRMIGGGA